MDSSIRSVLLASLVASGQRPYPSVGSPAPVTLRDVRRARRNTHERRFEELAHEQGWFATKRGWPDFFVITDEDEVIAVEVKPRFPRRGKLVKDSQSQVMKALSAAGIRCFVSDGNELRPFE